MKQQEIPRIGMKQQEITNGLGIKQKEYRNDKSRMTIERKQS